MKTTHLIAAFGVGGVGKTTTSAALGLALAKKNYKVAIVTVDPAKRLAQIMGLESLSSKPQKVFKDFLGDQSRGSLDALWIDTANVLEDIVVFHSDKFKNSDSIIHNRLFKILQNQLGGVEEYLGLEKLLELKNSGHYDFCILDTPPSQQGIDYLDAPKHILHFLDDNVLKYFLQANEPSTSSSLKGFFSAAFSTGAENAFTLFRKFLGNSFLTELAELLTALNPLREVFIKTAQQSTAWFQEPESRFMIVSSLENYPFQEAKNIRAQISSRFPKAKTQLVYNKTLPFESPNFQSKNISDLDQWIAKKQIHQNKPTESDICIPLYAQSTLDARKLLEIGEEIIRQWKIS